MRLSFQLDTVAAKRYAELSEEPGAEEIDGKLYIPHTDYGFTAVYKLDGEYIEMVLQLPKGDIIDRLLVPMHMVSVMQGL